MRTRTNTLTAAAVMFAALVAAPAAGTESSSDGGIVCWADQQGQRSCGDHVPPQYAQKQREVYDRRGMLVRTLDAAQTPQQQAANERKRSDAQRLEEQRQNDSFLLQTYASAGELKSACDNRLQTFDVHIELAEKAVRDGAASLKDLQDRAAAERAAGGNPDSELPGQIKSFESAQADNIRAVAQIKQDRDAAARRFDSDIRRYQELHDSAAAAAAAPPPILQAPTASAAP